MIQLVDTHERHFVSGFTAWDGTDLNVLCCVLKASTEPLPEGINFRMLAEALIAVEKQRKAASS